MSSKVKLPAGRYKLTYTVEHYAHGWRKVKARIIAPRDVPEHRRTLTITGPITIERI